MLQENSNRADFSSVGGHVGWWLIEDGCPRQLHLIDKRAYAPLAHEGDITRD